MFRYKLDITFTPHCHLKEICNEESSINNTKRAFDLLLTLLLPFHNEIIRRIEKTGGRFNKLAFQND